MNITEELAMTFLDESPSFKDKSILDFGCGNGHTACEFKRRGAYHVVALDRNERAGKYLIQEGIPFVTKIHDDMSEDPFDIIWCSHVLEHIEDPVSVLLDLRTIGRELWIAVPSVYNGYVAGHINNYTMPLLVEHLRRSGWDTERGAYKRIRGNLWVRVKATRTGAHLFSDYPNPMFTIMRNNGRCSEEEFFTTKVNDEVYEHNWK